MGKAPLGIEKAREERINSNNERMKLLGILTLSRDVNGVSKRKNKKKKIDSSSEEDESSSEEEQINKKYAKLAKKKKMETIPHLLIINVLFVANY